MSKQNKKKSNRFIVFIIVSLLVLALAGVGGIYYILFKNKSNSSNISGGKVLVNPVKGLSLEEAVRKFDASFVYYLLASIKAYNLHEAPFSSDLPKIIIFLEDDAYYGKIVDGKIIVGKGKIEDADIIIYSSKEEVIKIMQDRNYVKQSFSEGLSKIELKSDKLELYSKGYLDLYEEIN